MQHQVVTETRYAEEQPQGSLLDAVLAATPIAAAPADAPSRPAPLGRLAAFLASTDLGEALRLWFGTIPQAAPGELKRKLVRALNQDVGRIDDLAAAQVNAVLHHPDFQRLEAGWRGLRYLVDAVPDGANVKVRVLSASWKELARDQEKALEFDQSQLFRKVYNEEFGTPGGEPYGMLVGNYDVCHRPFPDHPTDDLAALRGIASVAAAAFAPFVAGVDPRVLELDSFADLDLPLNLDRTFEQLDYLKWRQFREAEDARFVGLALPRMLLRAPHADAPGGGPGFRFTEDSADRGGYLWGNPAFALAAAAARSFAESGWLADIRGARAGQDAGGIVTGLPAVGYGTGAAETPRAVTEVQLTDVREKELADLGFIPLCHTPGAAEAAFYTTPSAQKPKSFADPTATANARLSAMTQYMLCASRFAHYLKVMIRDRVGSYTTPEAVEDGLNKWLMRYVTGNDNASPETKAKYPLREGRAQVREIDGKPGSYRCTVHLRPHFQLDQVTAAIRLTTELNTRPDG